MISLEDATNREAVHLLRLHEGAGDRLTDLLRRALDVEIRQNARVSAAIRDLVGCHPGPDSGRRLESPYLWNLRIGEYRDSSIWFEIDNDELWFTLPLRLAGLLKFLAFQPDKQDSGDELAGFRTREEVLDYLERTGNRKYDPHYVNQLVEKLKKTLKAYEKRALILTSDQDGIRLLVRRGAVQCVKLDHIPEKQRIPAETPGARVKRIRPADLLAEAFAR
jgi:hypothetical protein